MVGGEVVAVRFDTGRGGRLKERVMFATDVLAGNAAWAVECGDAVAWLSALPDDSVDLLFTSPPYLEARTYGIGAGRKLDEWVAWMLEVFRAAAPKVRGLIALNCEGQTRDYCYLPAPFVLMADLHRAGFNLRKPPAFCRVGIPGSGGPDWLRNDWEPVVCVTRPGRLPWADPTACGKPPKWKPGGQMSNRHADGQRVNAQLSKQPKRTRAEKLAMGAKAHTKRDAGPQRTGDAMRSQAYLPPEFANPGNLVRCAVGGGRMGHDLAHENEAPFPVALAAFFVKSFCPPGGVVCDPFSGSGTTCHAAVEVGRRFVGCDVRQSQVDLAARRMATVTPDLFTGVES
jgi:hypothetical protein